MKSLLSLLALTLTFTRAWFDEIKPSDDMSRCDGPQMIPHIDKLDDMLSSGINVTDDLFLRYESVEKLLNESVESHIPVIIDDTALARRLVIANIPFIIKQSENVLDVQRLVNQNDFIEKQISHVNVSTISYDDDHSDCLTYDKDRKVQSTLKSEYEFMRKYNTSRRYITFNANDVRRVTPSTHDTLASYFNQFNTLVDGDDTTNFTMRLGFNDIIYAGHFDLGPNFLLHLCGEKDVIFFSYGEEDKLYWNKEIKHSKFRQSRVWPRNMIKDAESFDQSFPLFKQAFGLHAKLSIGDVLYIPPLWFHFIESRIDKTSEQQKLPHWLSVNAFAAGHMVNNQTTYPCSK